MLALRGLSSQQPVVSTRISSQLQLAFHRIYLLPSLTSSSTWSLAHSDTLLVHRQRPPDPSLRDIIQLRAHVDCAVRHSILLSVGHELQTQSRGRILASAYRQIRAVDSTNSLQAEAWAVFVDRARISSLYTTRFPLSLFSPATSLFRTYSCAPCCRPDLHWKHICRLVLDAADNYNLDYARS